MNINLIAVHVGPFGVSTHLTSPSWYRRLRGWLFSFGPEYHAWRLTVCGLELRFHRNF